MDKRILELLVKKKLGSLSLSEHNELSQLIDGRADLGQVNDTLDKFWNNRLDYEVERPIIEDAALEKLRTRLAFDVEKEVQTSVWLPWKKLISIAAVISIMLSVGYLLLRHSEDIQNQEHTVVTKKGSKSMIMLPDGSKVWLNNDSKITYNKSFAKEDRELTLVGEAYFEVVKDTSKPFVVHTKAADVRVLGTEFNVKAYAEEAYVETTLIKGAVELDVIGDHKQIISMKPNEKVIIHKNDDMNSTVNANKVVPKIVLLDIKKKLGDSGLVSETQWKENRLVFEQESLSNILLILERWYDVDIVLEAASAKDKKISGTFQDENISDVLKSVLAVLNLNYEIKNRQIKIYE